MCLKLPFWSFSSSAEVRSAAVIAFLVNKCINLLTFQWTSWCFDYRFWGEKQLQCIWVGFVFLVSYFKSADINRYTGMRLNVLTIAKRLKTDSFLLLTLWNSYEFLNVTEMAMEINVGWHHFKEQKGSFKTTSLINMLFEMRTLHNTPIETFLFISFLTGILGSHALRPN